LSVGLSVNQATIDSRAGNLVLQIRQLLTDCQTFKTWLDTQSDAALTNLGYVAADVTLLRASFTDLDNLAKVAHGLQATGASDFFFNAKKLTGVL
jgi:hypothetical protein